MIKVTLSNEILKYITEIDKNRYKVSEVSLPVDVASKLRKIQRRKVPMRLLKLRGILCQRSRWMRLLIVMNENIILNRSRRSVIISWH